MNDEKAARLAQKQQGANYRAGKRAFKAAIRKAAEVDDARDRTAAKKGLQALGEEGDASDKVVGHLGAVTPRADHSWVVGASKHGWYIPALNTYPDDQGVFEGDLGTLMRDWVLPGHVPPAPMLREQQSVITLGSCFARNLRSTLARSGVNASQFWIPSGLNNTFAILDFFSWCVMGAQTGRGFRYERNKSGEIQEWNPVAERDTYVEAFKEAGAFVFTIGLAEVWQDRETGSVFWRGIPNEIFDANRHVFRLSTVDENAANLRQTIALIRQLNPTAPIVLTLSPVPLLATFREISCLTADCVSKSVLRVALDQVMADARPNVYYWPSFEIVKWVGASLAWPSYQTPRDPSRVLVNAIINEFLAAYYVPDALARMKQRIAEAPAAADPEGED